MSGGRGMRDLLQQAPRHGSIFRRELLLIAGVAAVIVVCCAVVVVKPAAASGSEVVELLTRSPAYRNEFVQRHVRGSRIRAQNHVSSFFGVDGQLFAGRAASHYRGRTHMLASEEEPAPEEEKKEPTPEEKPEGEVQPEDAPQEEEEAPVPEEPVPEEEEEAPVPQEPVPEEGETAEQPPAEEEGDKETEEPEEEEDEKAEKEEESTPAEGSGWSIVPITPEEAAKYGVKADEEEKKDENEPSDFLKGIVQDVADHVMPEKANKILASSENSVKAAQSQLVHADHLREEATAERVKARLLAARLKKLEEYAKKKQERAHWFDKNAEQAEAEAKAEQEEVEKDKKAEEETEEGAAGDEKLLQV